MDKIMAIMEQAVQIACVLILGGLIIAAAISVGAS